MARISKAWGNLNRERRIAAAAAIGLFVTLFLPWYRVTVVQLVLTKDGRYHLPGSGVKLPEARSFSGWGAFSFVEAAVLVVAIGVLVLLYKRSEGRAFHLPGGDGTVITVAGGWTCFLVIWRMFDKQGIANHGQLALSSGIEWGIFAALAVAGLLTYAGTRIRAVHQPEPPLPTENYAVFDGHWHTDADAAHAARTAVLARNPRRRRTERPERTDRGKQPRPDPGTDRVAPEMTDTPRATDLRPARPATAGAEPRRRRPRPRSNWRPGESPKWTDEDSGREPGWLTAPRRPQAGEEEPSAFEGPTGSPDRDPDRDPDPPTPDGQLTIPLENE